MASTSVCGLTRARLARLDALLLFFLAALVLTSARANIQTDAVDYYAIVQRLVGDEPPILPHLPFVEQRSPGYPLLSLPAYALLGGATFWAETETVRMALPPPSASRSLRPSEQALLPPQPLRFSQACFVDFDLAPRGGLFRWRIIAAMMLTGFGFFFVGLLIVGRTLALLYPPPVGYSLPLLVVVTSAVFLYNLVNMPAYATLTAFGVSALFTWAWVRGWQGGAGWPQALAGLLAGLLVLTRLETLVIVAVLVAALALCRCWRFLCHFILGGLPALALLLLYNTTQFGNPLHADILKGDMNVLAFDPSYVLATLVRPQSGILFWSVLTCLGIFGLLLSARPGLRALGLASLALIALIALRVPVMYGCVGQGMQVVSGVVIACPPDLPAMLNLIRLDANRYVIPLAPFAVLGLRRLSGQLFHLIRIQPAR